MTHTMNDVDQYAVIGNPIAHSKSPLLQNAFAEQTQQQMEYTAIRADNDAFVETVNAFFKRGGKGLNVTVPFKEEAFNYADQLTSRAKRAGAVNTLWIDDKGVSHGDTTDGLGLVDDIQRNLAWPLAGQSILIIGAGGAVRGVLEPLIETQPKSITLVNRTVKKAEALADTFKDLFPIKACGFNALMQLENKAPFDLIINGTAASLAGELPPLPESIFHRDCRCYDMMYSKELTPFLEWAKRLGVTQLSDGLGMLVGQGAASFTLWRGVKPDVKSVVTLLRTHL